MLGLLSFLSTQALPSRSYWHHLCRPIDLGAARLFPSLLRHGGQSTCFGNHRLRVSALTWLSCSLGVWLSFVEKKNSVRVSQSVSLSVSQTGNGQTTHQREGQEEQQHQPTKPASQRAC